MSHRMRRVVIWLSVVAGVVFAMAGAVIVYAFLNLSAILNTHQHRILNRISAAMGRAITVNTITAHAGWGISVELSGVTIAEDPDFAQAPFVAAEKASADLRLIPMLMGEVSVKHGDLIKANIPILLYCDA